MVRIPSEPKFGMQSELRRLNRNLFAPEKRSKKMLKPKVRSNDPVKPKEGEMWIRKDLMKKRRK